jgi:hypothetical protein
MSTPPQHSWRTVFTTWDQMEAGFIQSLLEANNIACFTENRFYASMSLTGSGAAPIKITVNDTDEPAAKDIIAQYFEDQKNP